MLEPRKQKSWVFALEQSEMAITHSVKLHITSTQKCS